MLFPERMLDVFIAVPKKKRERILHNLRGLIHLDDLELSKTRKIKPDLKTVNETLAKLEKYSGDLKTKGNAKKSISPLLDSQELLSEIDAKTYVLKNEKKELKTKLKKIDKMMEILDTEFFVGIIQIFSKSLDEWEAMRSELGNKGIKVIATRVLGGEVIALVKGAEEGYNGDSEQIRTRLYKEKQKLESGLEKIKRENVELGKKYGPKINTLKKQVKIEMRTIEEKEKLTHSDLFTFIKGWIPERDIHKVDIEDGIMFTKEASLDAPTKLDNPWFFKPFENFMYMFALPRYGEFDPTPFISIFFPLFYGVMLSDAGYGLLLLLVSLAIRRKFKVFSELLLISAISTVFFGVIFDSYFGIALGKVVISPLQRPFQLLYYALVFGIFYVDLGLIMGLIQNLLNDKYYEALTKQISLLLFQFGAVLALIHVQGGLLLMLLGLGLKVSAENIRGFLDMPGFMSSIISFSRLAALALATAWIAFTVNFLAGLLASFHPWGIIPAILLLLVGHIGNFAFNAFGAFIHALRLHYVEFMGLFFTAKGKPYTPLGT